MSVYLDIIEYTLNLDIDSSCNVTLDIQDGITVFENSAKIANVRALDFQDGNNTTVDVTKDGNRVIVKVNGNAGGGGGTTLTDPLTFKGVIDCSANPNYPAADAGDVYKVSVAGKIGGGSGPNVEAGDTLLCITDASASGNHATVGTNWVIQQGNTEVASSAEATAGTDSAKIITPARLAEQMQKPTHASATASGTNTYTATLTPTLAAYAAYQRFYITFTNGNSSSSTLNIDGLGAKTIKKASGQNIEAGDISAGQVLELVYDGTNFQIIGTPSNQTTNKLFLYYNFY